MGRAVSALVLLLCLVASGCKREPKSALSAEQIRQITGELSKAAAEVAPEQTVIKTRKRSSASGTKADEIRISLRGAQATEDRVRQNLVGVAARHRLTVVPETVGGTTLRITLRKAGVVTHRIEIERLDPLLSAGGAYAPGQPRLAILLDDLGNDRTAAERIFALRVPITLSILPFRLHSEEIAREARKRGYEVMLHLPMQSVANEAPEPTELKPGLSREEVTQLVAKALEAVPGADGVNNHQGSEATSDGALMSQLMQVLKEEGVFYVDSRTTAATLAYEAAKKEGVRTAFRNVPFLDDVPSKSAVEAELWRAIRGAKRNGQAIAIGHPRQATLDALRELLPEARKEGVQLVFVSELVH
jgi:polysaccharide deacetylase 2 family uncharacterized protein YibQ